MTLTVQVHSEFTSRYSVPPSWKCPTDDPDAPSSFTTRFERPPMLTCPFTYTWKLPLPPKNLEQSYDQARSQSLLDVVNFSVFLSPVPDTDSNTFGPFEATVVFGAAAGPVAAAAGVVATGAPNVDEEPEAVNPGEDEAHPAATTAATNTSQCLVLMDGIVAPKRPDRQQHWPEGSSGREGRPAIASTSFAAIVQSERCGSCYRTGLHDRGGNQAIPRAGWTAWADALGDKRTTIGYERRHRVGNTPVFKSAHALGSRTCEGG